MRRRLLLVLVVLIVGFVVYSNSDLLLGNSQPETANNNNATEDSDQDIAEETEPIAVEQGTITIVNMDEDNDWPVVNAEFDIIDQQTGEIIETVQTNEEGKATSTLLDFGTVLEIEQKSVAEGYVLNTEPLSVEVNDENHELAFNNKLNQYIVDFERKENGEIEILEVYIPVPTVMQNPELPNGCEITALTAVLNYYGYDVSKTTMADDFLPQVPFSRVDGDLYGPDPYEAYAGNPRYERGGFFVYAPPIVVAAQDYLDTVGGTEVPLDVSGSTREEIYSLLNQGLPVVIWPTLELDEPRVTYSWYIYDTHEYFPAPVNLHATVINGYVGNEVHVMDPLKGQVIYDADAFFESYYGLGSHAMIVKPGE